jgi:hypothetical protein
MVRRRRIVRELKELFDQAKDLGRQANHAERMPRP